MSKKLRFQTPTGMHDLLPEDHFYLEKIYDVVDDIVRFYGFGKIDPPIVEDAALYEKGTGASTDIVEKQTYTFRTKGGDWLALRPEGTAPVVRAFFEHGMQNLPQPIKLWYFGPFFRYEHPQAGRFRQFHQFGFEVLGEQSPAIDSQIVQIFYNILRDLHFKKLIVEVNTIGDSQCRPYYKKLLVSYLKYRVDSLCTNCKRRAKENPLRTFDCKEEKCQRIKTQAPQMINHLCEECHHHFREFLEVLDEVALPYSLNPYLGRGLEYYTKTVFEIFEEGNLSKNALVGGGRYDDLGKILGGEQIPACGGAAGIERIAQALKEKASTIPQPQYPKIFLAQLGNLAKRKSLKLFEEFRKNRIPVAESFGRDSLKAQLTKADRIGANYTLILGQKEVLEGTIIVKDMKAGTQVTIKLEKAVKEMKKRLK